MQRSRCAFLVELDSVEEFSDTPWRWVCTGLSGVPNSDADFGANVTEGKVLASKRENAAYYSENMAKAGSTVAIDANFDAIQNHVNGMSIADPEALAAEESPVDAISGAPLVDTAGYLAAILAAAQE